MWYFSKQQQQQQRKTQKNYHNQIVIIIINITCRCNKKRSLDEKKNYQSLVINGQQNTDDRTELSVHHVGQTCKIITNNLHINWVNRFCCAPMGRQLSHHLPQLIKAVYHVSYAVSVVVVDPFYDIVFKFRLFNLDLDRLLYINWLITFCWYASY